MFQRGEFDGVLCGVTGIDCVVLLLDCEGCLKNRVTYLMDFPWSCAVGLLLITIK